MLTGDQIKAAMPAMRRAAQGFRRANDTDDIVQDALLMMLQTKDTIQDPIKYGVRTVKFAGLNLIRSEGRRGEGLHDEIMEEDWVIGPNQEDHVYLKEIL